MNVRKEYFSDTLYLGFTYPVGQIQKASPRTRSRRQRVTSEAKRKINAVWRKWRIMLLLAENFQSGRDLFVCLTFGGKEPSKKEAARCLEKFHQKMRRAYEKRGMEYIAFVVPEDHTMEGEENRRHFHVILTGCGRLMLGTLRSCWTFGRVYSEILRDPGDNFADTAEYLLKMRRQKGERAWSTTRNIRQPQDPLRRLIPEAERMEVPPGVKLIEEHRGADGEAGSYAVLVGRVVDPALYARYLRQAKHTIDLRDPWRRLERAKRRRRRQSLSQPAAASSLCTREP